MPQKPPRGNTRGPPQLVIPPPPPYPPPDTDIMDPTDYYSEAPDVTAPTNLVPQRMFKYLCICFSILLAVTVKDSFSRLSSLFSRHTCFFFSSLSSLEMLNALYSYD